MALNKHVKRKWLRALKSGEYTQGQGYLVLKATTGTTHHCCLGVLACEMVPEFVQANFDVYEVEGDSDMLPDDLAVMFGLDWDDQDQLAKMNDDGVDFFGIASWIETNL